MTLAIASNAAKAYGEVGRRSEIEGASPHRLIEMLLAAAGDKLRLAREAILNNQREKKGQALNKCIDILSELNLSLDSEGGGEIAANLSALYGYMQNEIILVNRDGNIDKLDQIITILDDLHSTWITIKPKGVE
jgi:flagellar protein FliS